MNSRCVSRPAVCCWLAFVLCCTAAAQQPATGLPSLASFAGGPFDTVDLANLDVHFSIPVFGRAGKGISFNYALGYDSLVWVPVNSSGASVWTPVNSNWGWRAVTEAATGYVTYSDFNFSQTCQQGGQFGPYGKTISQYFGFVYHDPTGTLHPFPGTVTVTTISNSNCGTIGTTVTPITNKIISDGSGYIIISTSTSSGLGQVTIRAPGGITILTPDVQQSTGAGSVTDANGNQISISSGGIITDTLGTTALTVTGTPSSGQVTYTYVAPNGANTSVTANYGTYTVQTCFQQSSIAEFPATSEHLINKITLADDSSYQFTYEPTLNCGANGSQVTGRIASVTLPTGGTISYTYGLNNSMMIDGSPSWFFRTLSGGQWGYVRGYQSGPSTPSQTTLTVTDSPGNNTTFNFSGIYETSRTTYNGTVSGGAILDYSYICYNWNATDCPTAVVNPSQIIQSRSFTDQPGGPSQPSFYSRINSYYDGTYGLPTGGAVWDYETSALLQQSTISYNSSLCSSKNICDHPSSVVIQNGSSQTVAQANHSYDGNGNTTQVSRWTTGSGYLNTGYSYNGNGTLHQVTDPNGTLTTYTYSGVCNSAFPTTVAVGSLSTQYSYNCNGGVVTSVTDPNNAVTSTSYTDPYFWRPSSSTDALSNITSYSYYTPTQFESNVTFNSGSSTTDILVMLDGLGRKSLVQQRQAPGENNAFDTVEYTYDVDGRLNFQSLPYFSSTAWSAGAGGPGITTAFDTLNRPVSITDGDGGSTGFSYSLNDAYLTVSPAPVGENLKIRQLEYDALSRLTSVCEVTTMTGSGTCAQNTSHHGFFTQYVYDPLGNLTNVTQAAQTRAYTYDGISRMISETNPESGTTGYKYDTVAANYCGVVTQYTSNGDLVAKTDANGKNVCYYYDALHRLTDVGNSSQSSTNPCLRFRYDNSTGVQGSIPSGVVLSHFMGRMVEAETDNCGTPVSTITDEWFNYSSRGETTDIYESTPNSGGYYHTYQPYYGNGARTSLQAFLPNGTAISDLFSYSLDGEGRPYGMTDTTGGFPVWSSTTYNPASQPLVVTQHYGGTETFQYDPNTGRMSSYTTQVNSTRQSGSLTWNANGTLQQQVIGDTANSNNAQTCTYAYDDLSRLASVGCTGSNWGQTFGYPDVYGNLTKQVPVGKTGVSFAATFNANNRVTDLGFSYDADGNALQDNLGNAYTYNVQGRAATAAGVQITYDAFLRAVERNSSGTYSEAVYAPTGEIFAYMKNGTTLTRYIDPMVAGMAAVHNGDGTGWFQHADWLGSSRISSDSSGTVYYDRAYAPFGEVYAEQGGNTLNRNFTGQREDTTPGIDDFLFRQYSASQGRWLSPDPAGLAAVDITNPQTWNRYAYLANNPLNKVDPLGLYDCSSDDGDDCECDDDECGTGGGGGGGQTGPVSPPTNAGLCNEGSCSGETGDPVFVSNPWGNNPPGNLDLSTPSQYNGNVGSPGYTNYISVSFNQPGTQFSLNRSGRPDGHTAVAGSVALPISPGVIFSIPYAAIPFTGRLCLGLGIGFGSPGFNGGVVHSSQNVESVLSGASVSVAGQTGWWGGQWSHNMSGMAAGNSGGTPGVSLTVSFSVCF